MSVIRPRPPEEPLAYRSAKGTAAAHAEAGRITAIRGTLGAAPAGIDLADRMLAEYDARRPESRLFAILAAAREIRDACDRLVVVAGGPIGPATRLLVATCCHPFHDQLPRGERGGRPRLAWLDAGSTNDEIQGLIDLVAPTGTPPGDDLLDRWAVMPIDAPHDDTLQAGLLGILLEPLARAVGSDPPGLAARVIPVAAAGSRLAIVARRLGCRATFCDLGEITAAQGVFTAAGLLPAAVAGIDVVRLLKGAAAMLRRFAEAPLDENPAVLDAALAAREPLDRSGSGRSFVGGGRWVAELAAWHGQLLPGRTAAGGSITRLAAGTPRRDGLVVPAGDGAVDDGQLAGSSWPDATARLAAPDTAAADVEIDLPQLDEHATGQLLQLLILSAAVEMRLRPGV